MSMMVIFAGLCVLGVVFVAAVLLVMYLILRDESTRG
jgi:hypothetical protein